MGLEGSATHENLKVAFARESQANRRYHWFAQQADVEGHPEAAVLFRVLADGEAGHAHGLLEYLAEIGDPITGQPIGDTDENLRSAIASETHESTELYPGFAKTAREEGFEEVAEWLETLARAEEVHAVKFDELLSRLDNG